MKPTDILKEEHRAIERMLNILDRSAAQIEAGQQVHPKVFEEALRFIRQFADGCHHQKEEVLLFPAMEQKGFPPNVGPIAVMLHEHNVGRTLVANMTEALNRYTKNDATAPKALAGYARQFGMLLRDHIAKEDNILFVMADQHFSAQEQQTLLAHFQQVEAQGETCSTKAEMLSILKNLEQSFTSSP